MKAYMSVPGVRAVCCIGPVRDSQHAEAEARMLLGETEPEAPLTVYLHVERLQGTARQDGQGRAGAYGGCLALAEALAAFVDDGQAVRS